MIHWVAQNLGTICICAIVLLLIGVALFSLLKDRRNGKSSCGCGCSGCSMRGVCHGAKKSPAAPKKEQR